jgi:hypothetical protein
MLINLWLRFVSAVHTLYSDADIQFRNVCKLIIFASMLWLVSGARPVFAFKLVSDDVT